MSEEIKHALSWCLAHQENGVVRTSDGFIRFCGKWNLLQEEVGLRAAVALKGGWEAWHAE